MNAPLPVNPSRNTARAVFGPLWAVQEREKQRVLQEIVQVRGLMPLLMKRRNGESWTREERKELVRILRGLYAASPYLLALAMPGSVLLLPFLAWWLDRRRNRRVGGD